MHTSRHTTPSTPPATSTPPRAFIVLAAVVCAVVALAGCGSTNKNIVAQVNGTPITRTDLNHWMATLAAGDYHEVSHGFQIPARLVTEPANYPACIASLQHAYTTAAHTNTRTPSSTTPQQTSVQLAKKCRQLYQAVRAQAMSYLVSAQWTIHLATSEGIHVSDTEITQRLRKLETTQFPGSGQFQAYLQANRRSLTDEQLVERLDLLSQKLSQKLATGGNHALTKLTETEQQLTTKTQCNPEYTVEHCNQYHPTPTPTNTPSPAVLMEQVATYAGRPCINHQACG